MIKEHDTKHVNIHKHNHHKDHHHEEGKHPHEHSESQEKQAYDKDTRLEYNDLHHFNEMIKEILAYNKDEGYDRFEEISLFIKRKMTKLSFQYFIPPYLPQKSIVLTPHEEKIFTSLNKKKQKTIETIDNYMEDVLSISRLLEWGGVSFGKNEWYKIRLAMKKILIESDASNLRFWGKIYGIDSDYYVIQGNLKNYPMENPKPHAETRGNEGLNLYNFWVTNSILEGWYELPDITAEQLAASKTFKYYFTGNLYSKVRGFNNFQGKESHLLKCQILRIMHSSNIVPDGYLRINEKFQEDLVGKVTEYADGDYLAGAFEDMRTDDRWVHEYAYIFQNGKIIDSNNDNQIERLRKIGVDEGYQKLDKEGNPEEIKYWKFRVIGDPLQYTKDTISATYATIVIKNTRWPGTTAVWKVLI